LDAATLPSWLAADDADLYRSIAVTRAGTPSPNDHGRYAVEIAELEAAGIVVDRDPVDQSVRRLYVARRHDDVWSIGIYAGNSPLDLAPRDGNPIVTRDDVSDVPAIAVADPFMTRVHGRWYMFFEVMTWPLSKGEIAYAESDDGIRWTYRQTVLTEAFHLSYPYVFEWQNDHYMVPESTQAHSVRLYRATTFPTRWSVVGTLLRGSRLMDPSIFRHGDRWWLFVESSQNGNHDTLRLYHADSLTGRWQEHPSSPIVQGNPEIARPAGRVLAYDDRVIRFAQNCRPRYGTEVRALEVTELTPTRYAERELPRSPILVGGNSEWNASGMHHVDAHRLYDGRWIAAVDGRAASTHEPA
jgi:hypothetical protein